MKTSFASMRRIGLGAAGLAAAVALVGVAGAASGPQLVQISNVPLLLVQPTQPEILIVLTNSQSMDGNLSGAIMTGSGSVSALQGSSSPLDYTVPNGFAPPAQSASGGIAVYTADISGTLVDNSDSRLNVAKEALSKVVTQYASSFSMGLMDYCAPASVCTTNGNINVNLYTTWLYLMSGSGGFTFGNTGDTPPSGTHWVANPCYQSAQTYCGDIDSVDPGAIANPLVAVAASSDDPDINDVLYAGGLSPVCLDYGTHTPPSPFPPNFTLANYNAGGILVGYSNSTGTCATATGPTNAGFVPYSPQVLYAQRGFGFYETATGNAGNLILPISPAACSPGSGNTNCNAPPSQAQLNNYIANFNSYFVPETNGTVVASKSKKTDIKALAVQSPIAGPLAGALTYFQDGYQGFSKPKTNTNCKAQQYVVLITDGLPTEDLSGASWPPLGSQSANGYGVHATFNLKGGGTVADNDPAFTTDVEDGLTTTVASTNDQALTDTLTKLGALESAGIQVYIVGMGAGVDPSKNPAAAATMKAMAIAGGTTNYFPAVTPQDVVKDMGVIFGQIQAANMSTTAVAVNSTSYKTGADVYQARFSTADFGWTGDLVAMPLNSDGTVCAPPTCPLVWDADEQMDASFGGTGWNSARKVVTVNSGTGVPFRWDQLNATQQSELESHWSLLTSSQQSTFGNNETTYGQAVLNYLRGDQSLTESNGGPFRDRPLDPSNNPILLGDIIDSAPLYVGAPNGLYSGTGYDTFAQTYANRTPVIYVGANDGMVHAFNAETGAEMFAYMPAGSFSKLADLTLPTYDANHEYFVDGSPNAGDVKFSDNTWHTILVGGLNDGGQGIYALDVTDPSNWNNESTVAQNVLWSITNATTGFSHLGLTYSQPQIAQLDINGTDTFVVIFGSGYNNDDGNPYLYVVDAETGALIKSFALCSFVSNVYCKSNEPNGLSTPVVISSTGSTVSNRVYAGDLQGNLWRIDLSDPNPANWTAALLFKAQSGSTDQPITTQPVTSFAPTASGGGVMVFFGTGEYLGIPDTTNTDTQSFYGVLDSGGAPATPYTQANLDQMTLTDTTVNGVGVRTVSGSPIDWTSQRGWFMNFPDSGERMITDPRILSGRVIFTTFVPSTVACSAGGSSWLMVMNYATGGELPAPEFDINGDNQLNSGDQVNGQNPVGLSLGAGYAASPRLVMYHQGPFNDLKLVTISSSPVKTIKERGVPPGELSWTEIR